MITNWKTTAAGIIVAILAALTALHYITPQVSGAIMTIAVSAGLVAASDAPKV